MLRYCLATADPSTKASVFETSIDTVNMYFGAGLVLDESCFVLMWTIF